MWDVILGRRRYKEGDKEEHRCGVGGMFVSPLKFIGLNSKPHYDGPGSDLRGG